MRFTEIKLNDIANSNTGITLSVWTQGCPHKCKGCFNMETWDFNGGRDFTYKDLDYVVSNINKNGIERSLSILGGEPLAPSNVIGVIELCKTIKELYPKKTIYLWTGYVFEEFDIDQREALKYVDILVDGKFEIDKRDIALKLKGSSNQRLISVKESLQTGEIVLYKGE